MNRVRTDTRKLLVAALKRSAPMSIGEYERVTPVLEASLYDEIAGRLLDSPFGAYVASLEDQPAEDELRVLLREVATALLDTPLKYRLELSQRVHASLCRASTPMIDRYVSALTTSQKDQS